MKDVILVSSDHHANWGALEYWFKYCGDKIPFVIVGDLVSDYNFEDLSTEFGLNIPKVYILKTKDVSKVQILYDSILRFHAKKLAGFIDKYRTKTYFLHGNHEPIYFAELVFNELKNKDLFVDLNSCKGIINVNGLNVAGITNTNQVMPFLSRIFSDSDLDKFFSHQRSPRPTIKNFDKNILRNHANPVSDFDWVRIMAHEVELDVFFTHGQVGRGSWRREKHSDELPTLVSAAKLSDVAKLTVEGHLHSSFAMKNCLDKPMVRAVGNMAILIKKERDTLNLTKLQNDFEYNATKNLDFTIDDLKNNISVDEKKILKS